MTQPHAPRQKDLPAIQRLADILLKGDIGMVLLLGGAGLLLWAGFGFFSYHDDLEAYAKMFPVGNSTFWLINYILCGLGLWYLAATNLKPMSSLVVGMWVLILWGWSTFARMTAVATVQTGNATSVIYFVIGALIIHRSAKR